MSWPRSQLGDVVADARAGFAHGGHKPDGVFQFRMNNITREGQLDLSKMRRVSKDVKNFATYLLEPGDVLFNATNSPDGVGKSIHFGGLDEPAVFSNHFIRLRPEESALDGRFLARWLHAQFRRGVFEAMCNRWVNQASIKREALLTMIIPAPPIEEQRRIADVLDRADDLRAKRRAALEKLESLKQSIFLDMFGARSVAWKVEQLADVVRPDSIVTYGIVQAGPEHPDGVPYIRTGDIVDGEIRTDGLRHTDPAIAAKFGRSRVGAGELVMSIRATVGTTAVVPGSLDGANLTQGTARIAPGPTVDGDYLLYYLRSPRMQNWIQRQVKGATFREITLARLRQLPVEVPPLGEQRRFAARAQFVDRCSANYLAAGSACEDLFRALQQRAFAGAL